MTTADAPATDEIDWYFDFVSPFSYIALHRLRELQPLSMIRPRPVLLAGLLKHWGQLGPAELPTKRRWTYRMADWQAQQAGLTLRFPAVHPFNPLPYLRLAIAAGGDWDSIHLIFDQLWTTTADPGSAETQHELAARLDVDPAAADADWVKHSLRETTDEAANKGVFGVPSLVIGDELFWGADAIDFAAAYLADRRLFEQPEFKRLDTLPVGVRRQS
ncbi:2-hydroxychromene-2-carboxylate isomerase [Salinisphaera aquimarina]|uniref:2-hydroxychromene-2-carboxylate isomerase n=1 Tax=Salinisphaera aquimarina TaxID=2094031 RepID=A0ABV7ER53_9GAMM